MEKKRKKTQEEPRIICINGAELIRKYQGANVEKEINYWGEHFNKNPFQSREKKQYIQSIKRDLIFINQDYKEPKPTEKKEKEEVIELSEEEMKKIIVKNYPIIVKLLKKYMIMKEDDYLFVTLWIIGTYFHKDFSAYPYLFFNAMKGSGKSRVLSLITHLCGGKKLNSLTEATLFRTKGMIAIDEFEAIGRKGSENLRELLNSAYKKGDTVIRMKKINSKEGETQEPEEFEVYRPIAMANIYGMNDVLGDRCIELILEKSEEKKVVTLLEDFDENPVIQRVLVGFVGFVALFRKVSKHDWNDFASNFYSEKTQKEETNTSNTTYTTNPTNTINTTNTTRQNLFNKIIP